MTFAKTYTMSPNPIPPISWDDYSNTATQEFKNLLDSKAEERVLQEFLEQNPCFIPGAYGTQSKSGHAPMHWCLFTQPRLPGLASKVPDFMWISKNSDYINPVLIEIESPKKLYFNKNDSLSADFNQAMTQILDWRAWFDDPANVQIFQREYRIDDRFQFNKRKVSPLFVLIYGRTQETENSQTRANRKSQLSREDITVMSYDRLAASHDQSYFFCGRACADGFDVVEFPEYLCLSPCFAEALYLFRGQAEAIEKNQRIQPERKRFLVERLDYWNEWVRSGAQGIRNTGDKE
jgi:hypothetical protein